MGVLSKRPLAPVTTAFRTLTVIPIPGRETERLSQALPFFPLVGLALACVPALSLLAGYALGVRDWSVLALVALALTTALTGGLHLDGLADAADAFAPGRAREKILEILRDPHVGSFGVCAIVFDLLIKSSCWILLFDVGEIAPVVLSLVVSRSLQSIAMSFFPVTSSKGMAVSYAQDRGRGVRIASVIVAIVVAASMTYFLGPLMGGVAVVLTWTACLGLAWYFTRRIGGINGDCVGAISECGEVIVLIVAAVG